RGGSSAALGPGRGRRGEPPRRTRCRPGRPPPRAAGERALPGRTREGRRPSAPRAAGIRGRAWSVLSACYAGARQVMSSSSEAKSPAGGRRERPVSERRGTPGGSKLRGLRERAGRTQLWVELEAELGAGYLQRVESGKIALPERVTVERILEAIQAPFADRREALELFGYAATTRLPTPEELAGAREAARPELEAVGVPAYALDCAHRLVAWNRAFPLMLGVGANDPWLGQLAGRSILAAWFEPASPLGRLVVDPDEFLPALIRAMRHEMRSF